MSDDLGCLTDQRFGRHTLDLYGIVGNQTVAALDKLNGGFTLTNAAVTEKQDTLAVNLNENTVAGDARGKLDIQIRDQGGHKFARAFLGRKDRHIVLVGKGKIVLGEGKPRGYDHRLRLGGQEAIHAEMALLVPHAVQIIHFGLTEDLDALGLVIIEKSRKLKPRAVDTRHGDHELFGGLL